MKISTKMIKGILGFSGVLFLLAPLTVFAQGDLIVIPAAVKPLKNIVTVSQSTIKGGVYSNGTNTCVACDNGSGNELLPNCGI